MKIVSCNFFFFFFVFFFFFSFFFFSFFSFFLLFFFFCFSSFLLFFFSFFFFLFLFLSLSSSFSFFFFSFFFFLFLFLIISIHSDEELCGLRDGSSCSETFNDLGTYYRGCSIGPHCSTFGMKLKIVVQEECDNTTPDSPKYRSYNGDGNNFRNPTWGSVGSAYKKVTVDYFDRDFYAYWGTDSDFADLLYYCSDKAKENDLSYIDGGGGIPFLTLPPPGRFDPPREHFWSFADPVLFCKYYLVNYLNATDRPAGLTQEALDRAPVQPYPRQVSNIVFSQRQKRTSTYTNELGNYWGMLMTVDGTSQFVDRAYPTVVPWSQCDNWYDQGCACCSDPAADYTNCVINSGDCYYGVGRMGSLNNEPITEDRPRVYYNQNSHFLDLSQIYGNDDNRAEFVDSNDASKLNMTGVEIPFSYFFFFGGAFFRDEPLPIWKKYPRYSYEQVPPHVYFRSYLQIQPQPSR